MTRMFARRFGHDRADGRTLSSTLSKALGKVPANYGGLLGLCVLAGLFLGYRIHLSGNLSYVFLAKNLLLALSPLAAAHVAERTSSRIGFVAAASVWLIVFPNAPYLVTDLIHLRPRPPVPYWFDIGLLATFALAGFSAGLLSLEIVHRNLARRFSRRRAWIAVFGSCLLSGYGIYIGRFLRWNSWDVVTRPSSLLSEILPILFEPHLHPRALGVSLMFGTLVFAVYATLQRARTPSQAQELGQTSIAS